MGFIRDKKIQLILAEFGATGVLIYNLLLCSIYGDKGYYKNVDADDFLLVSKEIGAGCSATLVKEVVDRLVSRGLFEKSVYDSFGVLTSRSIQKRYFEIVKKRKDIAVIEEYFLLDEKSSEWSCISLKNPQNNKNGINPDKNGINPDKNGINPIKESKVKNTEYLIKRESARAREVSLSKSQQEFDGAGLTIKCDVEIPDERRKDLITAILASEFLQGVRYLSWFIKKDEYGNLRLDKACAGFYKSFKKKPKEDFPQHEYSKEELDGLFDDIENLG